MSTSIPDKYTPDRDEVLKALGAVCEIEYNRLQEQLKEANDVIISVAVMPSFPINPKLCREYLKKWGVK